jgi:hypothetical protein
MVECCEPLPNFVFNFNLRRYTEGRVHMAIAQVQCGNFKPVLKPPNFSPRKPNQNIINCFLLIFAFNFKLRRYTRVYEEHDEGGEGGGRLAQSAAHLVGRCRLTVSNPR